VQSTDCPAKRMKSQGLKLSRTGRKKQSERKFWGDQKRWGNKVPARTGNIIRKGKKRKKGSASLVGETMSSNSQKQGKKKREREKCRATHRVTAVLLDIHHN